MIFTRFTAFFDRKHFGLEIFVRIERFPRNPSRNKLPDRKGYRTVFVEHVFILFVYNSHTYIRQRPAFSILSYLLFFSREYCNRVEIRFPCFDREKNLKSQRGKRNDVHLVSFLSFFVCFSPFSFIYFFRRFQPFRSQKNK